MPGQEIDEIEKIIDGTAGYGERGMNELVLQHAQLKQSRSQTRAMWLSVGISILALIISIIALCSTANAHPGRVDKDGGHTNRKTGKYHTQQHKK